MEEIRMQCAAGSTVISDEDYEYCKNFRWYLRYGRSGKGSPYCARTENHHGKTVNFYLHREIAQRMTGLVLDSEDIVDHRNRNSLDNRRENLRVVSRSENCQNKAFKGKSAHGSKFSGVTSVDGKWRSQICVLKEDIYLGTFDIEYEAAHAYDLAAVKYYGTGARLNFPDELLSYISQLSEGKNPKISKTIIPTSKFDGVSWNKSSKSWMANITIRKERQYLGIFPTEEEAARARDLGAIKLIGRHATLNFPKLRQEYITQLENGFDPIPTKHVRTSKFKGVTFRKDIGGGRWQAYVTENGKRKYLPGTFETEHIAKSARDAYLKSR